MSLYRVQFYNMIPAKPPFSIPISVLVLTSLSFSLPLPPFSLSLPLSVSAEFLSGPCLSRTVPQPVTW